MKPNNIKRDEFDEFDIYQFWSKVNKVLDNNICWEWMGSKRPDGYGQWWFKACQLKAHRVAYTLVKGDIPQGLTIDHLCKNKGCCNPDHLEPVTQSENTLRYLRENYTGLCKYGHEKEYKKQCKVCNKIRQKEWREDNIDRSHEISQASYYRVGKETRRKKKLKIA